MVTDLVDPLTSSHNSPPGNALITTPLWVAVKRVARHCRACRRVSGAMLCVVLGWAATVAAEPSRPAEAPLPAKVHRYARRVIQRYDLNGDGQLQEVEWRKMHGQPALMDANQDGVITVDELAQWVATYGAQRRIRVDWPFPAAGSEVGAEKEPGAEPEPTAAAAAPSAPEPAAGVAGDPTSAEAAPRETKFHLSPQRLPAGLPDWFRARDLDGDGQLTLSEFAPHATAAQQQEFVRYDLNGDGLLTPQEYLKATRPAKSAKARAKP